MSVGSNDGNDLDNDYGPDQWFWLENNFLFVEHDLLLLRFFC